jgi:hypothetical protein
MTTLFPLPPAEGALTPRQAHALQLLRQTPEGLTSAELGREIHLNNGCGYCTTDPCKWASPAGQELGRSLRKRQLAIRRKNGRWQALTGVVVDGYDPATAPLPF